MSTQNGFNLQTYHDSVLLRKISQSKKGDFQFGKYLKEYQSRISHNRMMFLKYRGTITAYLCNMDANNMQKLLDFALQERKNNDIL